MAYMAEEDKRSSNALIKLNSDVNQRRGVIMTRAKKILPVYCTTPHEVY